MSTNDLFFIIALICSCACSYIFGGIIGYRKGKRLGFTEALIFSGESAMDIFRRLQIDPKLVVEATRQSIIDEFHQRGFDKKQSEVLADRFLKS